MITDRATAKRSLDAALSEEVDTPAAEYGFRRRSNTLAYRRSVKNGHQRLVFDFDLHPRYARDGILMLPYGEVTFPEVMELTVKLDPPRYVSRDFTLRFDLREFAVGSRRELLVRGDEDSVGVAGWVGSLLNGKLGILFEELNSPSSFIAWAHGDRGGVGIDNHGWVAVAAAHLWLDDPAGALATLATRIDPDDPNNKRYLKAFELVRSANG
ncbi:hypothetical protein F4560_000008 [Saccharothrix ecbatanensis]|uniref:Uncharacterized protein n=1 Tax=Saccharothrix ecbatanensis TaxID=1105145 RepID=A0A7W9HDK7_9PSEU|nr:hypothetical protein [Saccharothrix ecbatanensis]MBB5800240.1 hypothetical protein [Saccharothrix ecbatanensis]